jgi:hypothetical protein
MPLGRPVLRAGVLLAVASAGALLVSRLSSTPAPAPAQLEQRRLSPAASLMIDRMARSILQGGAGRDEDEMGSQIENWARAVHVATHMQHAGESRLLERACSSSSLVLVSFLSIRCHLLAIKKILQSVWLAACLPVWLSACLSVHPTGIDGPRQPLDDD